MGRLFFFGSLFAVVASANPAIDCYKAAMKDPAIFANSKAANGASWAAVEEGVAQLCAGVRNVAAPMDCFKAAMADSEVLANSKGANGTPWVQVERAAAKLCHGQ